MLNRYFIIFCSFIGFSLSASQLSVSPTYFEFNHPPGQAVSENVTVYNASNDPMHAQIYVGDFWYDKEGKRSFPPAGSSPYSGASWISLSQKQIEVPPHGQVQVPVIFSIPVKSPLSSYATLFVEKVAEPKDRPKRSNVNISLRIAVPLLYKRPDVELSKLGLVGFSLVRPTRFKPLLLKFILNNQDEAHVFPQGNITIVKNPSKEFVAKDEIHKERVILPKQKVDYEVSLPLEPQKGKYEGLLTLFYGKEKTVVKNFSFIIP